MATKEEIQNWVNALADQDGLMRAKYRKKLEDVGKSATPYLIRALKDPNKHVRWESAKALGVTADTLAIPSLVETLMDESVEVRWLAAEALINQPRESIVPLLNALIEHFDSVWMRQGTYHVLHTMERNHMLSDTLQNVLDALRSIEPEVTAPWAAERALESLLGKTNESIQGTNFSSTSN